MESFMSVGKSTLYIKGDQSVEVQKRDVTLGDLLTMEYIDGAVLAKLKTLKVLKFPEMGKHRYVVSVMKLIQIIHAEYPNMEIQNLGAADIIIAYEMPKSTKKWFQYVKTVLVFLITFVGASFAIVTFNNDSNVTKLFSQIYELFMGQEKQGFSILELMYCIGVVIGILVFFNHFGKKKFTADPTPIEVEMRLYENDIQTTLIQSDGRKGVEMDVDTTNPPCTDRS